MKKRILITGGCGFIGRHLVEKLMESPKDIDYIHIVDNLSNSSYDPTETLWWDNDPFVTVYIDDVENFKSSYPYNYIYHLASPVGPAGVLNYAGKMVPMIINDTNKLAQLAIKYNARMIDISTSEVYGKDPGEIAQKEDIEKIVPSNITIRLEYGIAKLASEVFLQNLVKTTRLQVNIIRPFNIIGKGQKGEVGFVLPRFIEQALAQEDLTIFWDGKQKRCFTSAYDIVDALLAIQGSKLNGEIFNIGNPANICSIEDLGRKVIELTGSKSKMICCDPRNIFGPLYAEAWNKIPDITKVKDKTNWHPTWNLDTIIKHVIKWYHEEDRSR